MKKKGDKKMHTKLFITPSLHPVKNAYRASVHALILTHVFMISPA